MAFDYWTKCIASKKHDIYAPSRRSRAVPRDPSTLVVYPCKITIRASYNNYWEGDIIIIITNPVSLLRGPLSERTADY